MTPSTGIHDVTRALLLCSGFGALVGLMRSLSGSGSASEAQGLKRTNYDAAICCFLTPTPIEPN